MSELCDAFSFNVSEAVSLVDLVELIKIYKADNDYFNEELRTLTLKYAEGLNKAIQCSISLKDLVMLGGSVDSYNLIASIIYYDQRNSGEDILDVQNYKNKVIDRAITNSGYYKNSVLQDLIYSYTLSFIEDNIYYRKFLNLNVMYLSEALVTMEVLPFKVVARGVVRYYLKQFFNNSLPNNKEEEDTLEEKILVILQEYFYYRDLSNDEVRSLYNSIFPFRIRELVDNADLNTVNDFIRKLIDALKTRVLHLYGTSSLSRCFRCLNLPTIEDYDLQIEGKDKSSLSNPITGLKVDKKDVWKFTADSMELESR